MSSTNGASGGGSGTNKESFDDLFKTIQKLEEKVQTDAARHNVNVVTLKNELSRQNSRVIKAEQRREHLLARKAQLEKTLATERRKTQQVRDAAADTQAILVAKKEVAEQMKKRHDEIAALVASQEKGDPSMDATMSELTVKVEKLKSLRKRYDSVKVELDSNTRKAADMKTAWEKEIEPNFQAQVSALQAKRVSVEGEIKAVRRQITDCEVPKLRTEVSQLESQLSEKTANVDALALDVGELEAQVKTANEEAAEVRIRLKEAISRRDCSRSELDEANRQKTSYRKKLDEVMARKEQLLAALDIKSEEEKKLKKLQEDIHAQNTILFDMQVQVKELTEVVNETKEIEESNAKQTAEVAKANEALDARESELEPKITEAHGKVAHLKRAIAEGALRHANNTATVKRQSIDLEALRAKIQATNDEIESLRETQCHAEQMIGANAAALEENGRRLSEGRGVYDEVKGLEVRVAQSKEAYAMYDENLSVMSQEMRHQTDGVLENIQIEQDQLKAKETAIAEAIQRKDDEMMELKKKVEQEKVRLVDLERQMTEQAVREAVDSAMARLPKDVQDKIKSMEREADPELPAATDEVLNNSSVMGVASDASFETAFDA